jgi:hypothetical protein
MAKLASPTGNVRLQTIPHHVSWRFALICGVALVAMVFMSPHPAPLSGLTEKLTIALSVVPAQAADSRLEQR